MFLAQKNCTSLMFANLKKYFLKENWIFIIRHYLVTHTKKKKKHQKAIKRFIDIKIKTYFKILKYRKTITFWAAEK